MTKIKIFKGADTFDYEVISVPKYLMFAGSLFIRGTITTDATILHDYYEVTGTPFESIVIRGRKVEKK